jgi:hypothetical protein
MSNQEILDGWKTLLVDNYEGLMITVITLLELENQLSEDIPLSTRHILDHSRITQIDYITYLIKNIKVIKSHIEGCQNENAN